MLGNFSCCNPARLYFGEDALDNLGVELSKYGKMSCWPMAVRSSQTMSKS